MTLLMYAAVAVLTLILSLIIAVVYVRLTEQDEDDDMDDEEWTPVRLIVAGYRPGIARTLQVPEPVLVTASGLPALALWHLLRG